MLQGKGEGVNASSMDVTRRHPTGLAPIAATVAASRLSTRMNDSKIRTVCSQSAIRHPQSALQSPSFDRLEPVVDDDDPRRALEWPHEQERLTAWPEIEHRALERGGG